MKFRLLEKVNIKPQIDGVTLLTKEEMKKLPTECLQNDSMWWLKSPGRYEDTTMGVTKDGKLFQKGYNVERDYTAVRPVLIISNLDDMNLQIGKTIKIFNNDWFIVSNDKVLLKGDLGYHIFDISSNNYETSLIKSFLENWLEEQMRRYKNEIQID